MSIEIFSSTHKPDEMPALEAKLHNFVFGNTPVQDFILPSEPLYNTLPSELHSILHDSFLTSLSEIFSDTSNDGPYEIALRTGKSILAVYMCIYPALYPQIGKLVYE
jgi:hypothetical protein